MKRTRRSGFILNSLSLICEKWKHVEYNILGYDDCNNNKDFRSYPEMAGHVILRKFYSGIYVFD
jgi:hypothetical protein